MENKIERMDSRERFHAALSGEKLERPPFWMMRQAGRYLPEYRALKERHGFLKIVQTPELAVEAALQPMKRFDFDCSILFSDILVMSEALGFPYSFKDGGGIELLRSVKNSSDISGIEAESAVEKLQYVAQNLKLLRRALPQKGLIGFCASPFTLAAYMIEGGSSTGFEKFKKFISEERGLFEKLMDKITLASIEYLKMQIECGIDGFQIFDSHASLAPKDMYFEFSGKNIEFILRQTSGLARSIVSVPEMTSRFGEVCRMGADAYSLDSSKPLSQTMKTWKGFYALQGNLDPNSLSNDSPKEVARKTEFIISDMIPFGRHIFNLGHGIRPDAKIENVEAMCELVKNFAKK